MIRARDERGQTGAETAGVMLVVALVVGALASSGTGETVARETKRLVCQIAGGDDCDPAPPTRPVPAADGGGEPSQGIPLDGRPLIALPFPGTVTVRCTYAPGSENACRPSGSGVSVRATAELKIERTETALDANGCPQQRLSVRTAFELGGAVSGGVPQAGGTLSTHLGHATEYEVTVSPDAADALAAGDREPPNPVDPTTIAVGESVELSEEYYVGMDAKARYRALQARLGYDEGRRVSSGVLRVNPSTVRVVVGDEDFVRQSLFLGVGMDYLRAGLTTSGEASEGQLHAVDIDISTSSGWAAYQDFLATGTLPEDGAAGTADATVTEIGDISDSLGAELVVGDVALGGMLQDSEGHRTVTTHADGSVDVAVHARLNEVGLSISASYDPAGERVGEPIYSVQVEGGDENSITHLQEIDGDAVGAPEDGHVRLDFTESELYALRELALQQVADGLELTPEQVETGLAGNGNSDEFEVDGYHYGVDGPYASLVLAETPEQMLIAFQHGLAEAGVNANPLLYNLEVLMIDQEAELPGDLVTPSCG